MRSIFPDALVTQFISGPSCPRPVCLGGRLLRCRNKRQCTSLLHKQTIHVFKKTRHRFLLLQPLGKVDKVAKPIVCPRRQHVTLIRNGNTPSLGLHRLFVFDWFGIFVDSMG